MPDNKETYLGDGLFVYKDAAEQVVLAASNGQHYTNVVYLEPDVLRAFLDWLQAEGLV